MVRFIHLHVEPQHAMDKQLSIKQLDMMLIYWCLYLYVIKIARKTGIKGIKLMLNECDQKPMLMRCHLKLQCLCGVRI